MVEGEYLKNIKVTRSLTTMIQFIMKPAAPAHSILLLFIILHGKWHCVTTDHPCFYNIQDVPLEPTCDGVICSDPHSRSVGHGRHGRLFALLLVPVDDEEE